MYWTLTITRLSASELGMDQLIRAITDLLRARGQQGFDFTLSYQRAGDIGACPECRGDAGLHALSCASYERATGGSERLSAASLEKLRSLLPFQSIEWLPDEALPVVELRQDQLEALISEVDSCRRGE